MRSKPARVLVIEDDAGLLDAVSRLLVFEGYEVTAARTGTEGLHLWREQGADLALTDLQMPGLHGLEVIVQLRASAPALPIVATSGRDRGRDLDLLGGAGLLGAVGLLAKPFTADKLTAAIAAALGGKV